jgi:hypothetical protein
MREPTGDLCLVSTVQSVASMPCTFRACAFDFSLSHHPSPCVTPIEPVKPVAPADTLDCPTLNTKPRVAPADTLDCVTV